VERVLALGEESGVGKGTPFVWEGSLDLAIFGEVVFEFPVHFTKENPL
jgi:hypothetical protein